MKFIGIIPSRYQSNRFPGKPLADVCGKSMIQRVYEQVKKSSSLSKVVVATDDERIEQHVKDFDGDVVMTSTSHKCGTDRCFEAIQKLNADDWDVVINIQGDEPFIHPGQIDELAKCFQSDEVGIATLVKQINTTEELLNPNIPKVLINKNKEAIYFSRTPLPFINSKDHSEWLKSHDYYKHIGIYGYKVDVLQQIVRLEQSPLENAESLEQLRWIENGFKINAAITDYESKSIDTSEDLIESPKNEIIRKYEMGKPVIRRNDLIYPELSYEIVGCAYEVFKELGFGHSEKTYQQAMAILFNEKKWNFREQVYCNVKFRNVILKKRYLDFEVESKIIVELKKNFHFSKAHIDQVLDYLKLHKLKLAILINFGKEGVTYKRIINVFN